jgi:hypothetical protein
MTFGWGVGFLGETCLDASEVRRMGVEGRGKESIGNRKVSCEVCVVLGRSRT